MIPIKQSLRTLARFKTYTIINVAGLVLSLSCVLILMRYIHQEYTVNHFCPELERTFVVTRQYEGKPEKWLDGVGREPSIMSMVHDASVERMTNFIWYELTDVDYENRSYKLNIMVVDSLFADMVPCAVVHGQHKVLTPSDALISTEYAKRIFGKEDPLGKTIKTQWERDVVVKGVFDKNKNRFSFPYDMVLSDCLVYSWNRSRYSLVQLNSAQDVERINSANNTPLKLVHYFGRSVVWQLERLQDLHFSEEIKNRWILKGNKLSVNILSAIALLLLCIGIFNYVMLHSVLMQKRNKEFGVKKVYGESKWELFCQLFLENLFLSLFALLFVWIIIELTQGVLDYYYYIPVATNVWFDVFLTSTLCLTISLLTTLIPFIKQQRTATVVLFRNISGSVLVSRPFIMWFQFVITVFIVLLSGFFYNQLNFMLDYDVNYRTDNIIRCKLLTRPESNNKEVKSSYSSKLKQHIGLIKQRMQASPLFSKWSYGIKPTEISVVMDFNDEHGANAEVGIKRVDNAYMELLDYKFIEGSLWADSIFDFTCHELIITESVKRYFNIENIKTARLRPKRPLYFSTYNQSIPWYTIVGVVEDFKTGTLTNAPQMIVFQRSVEWEQDLLAQVIPGKREEAILYLYNLYREINGDGDFDYDFVEDDIAAQYSDEQRQMRIYITFALIAVFIACLGLFGLSLYDIRQRYREIAIRKINGASKGAIFRLLMRKYVYIIGSAFVVSSAVSYVVIEKYMENFYHRAPLSGWIFVVALLLISVVAFATLWWQVRNAIRLNPAEVIKME
ncbi:MAG: ABC transporter permease [Marinifilaceae bacterium]